MDVAILIEFVELALNLVWVALGMAGLVCWCCTARDARLGRRSQFVALTMLLLILFPVISVTDDISAAHNPAEADTFLRRDELPGHFHTIAPDVAILPHAQILDVCVAFLGPACRPDDRVLVPQVPARFVLFTRPPPSA